MTAKEALWVFEKRRRCAESENCGYRHTKCDYWVDADELKEAEQKAVEALEKQIPVDPLDPELGISPRHPIIIPCGDCGMELSDHMWEYCPYCGQKILWKDSKG